MQSAGLEWLHRLSQEPRRLFKRYIVHGLPFAAGLLGGAAIRGTLPKGRKSGRYGPRRPSALLVDDDEFALDHLEVILSTNFPELDLTKRTEPDASGEHDFYFLDNDFNGDRIAPRLAAEVRRQNPEATIFAFSAALDVGSLKGLINAGCDGACDKSDPASWRPVIEHMRLRLAELAEGHKQRSRAFGGVRHAAASIQLLLRDWNERQDPRPEVISFEPGTVLETHAVVQLPNGRVETLPRGSEDPRRRVVVGVMDAIDAGDGDELELRPESATTSGVVRFVNGRECARRIEQFETITYDVDTGRTATEVAMRLVVRGAIRVTSGSQLLHEDENDRVDEIERTVDISIADPRLWRDSGTLALQIRALAASGAEVARILYLAEGDGTPLGGSAQAEQPERAADARIRAWIVPADFADVTVRTGRSELERAFFGGRDYRRTGEPNPRNTSGSVATLVERVSGGISELRGRVLEPFVFGGSASDLGDAARREAFRAGLVEHLDRAARTASGVEPDVVLVVTGGPLPIETVDTLPRTDGESTPAAATIPVAFVEDREGDGSVLASGTALSVLLRALYGFEDLGTPASGNFGSFHLPSLGAGHTPQLPSGPNLAHAGWADVVRVAPKRDESGQTDGRVVGVSPLHRSRTLLRLPGTELPGRPDLFVETHERSTSSPWEPTSGALVYWDYGDAEHAPRIRAADGRSARVRRVRLSPDRPAWQAAFRPADASDLFRAAARLDDSSSPAVATLRGDLVWTIPRMRTETSDGAVRLWLDYLPVDLLSASAEPVWSIGWNDRFGPLSPTSGAVRRIEATHAEGMPCTVLALETRDETAGTTLRGRFPLPLDESPRRILVVIDEVEDASSARIRLRGAGARGSGTWLDATMDARGFRGEVDIPAGAGSSFDILIEQQTAGPFRCRIASLLIVPRAESDYPVQLPDLAHSTRLVDGTTYGRTAVAHLDAAGLANLSAPVVVPKSPSALRMVFGLEAPSSEGRVEVTLRGRVGSASWHTVLDPTTLRADGPDARSPLTIAVSELPAELKPGVHFLDLEVEGTPGARVHFVTLGIDEF